MQKDICLSAQNLKKRYGATQAVNDVSFSLASGECLALLGPNGAGKSTICEMLEGLIVPDFGQIIFGKMTYKTHKKAILKKIGVQLQESHLYKKYTVKETLQLFASFYDNPVNIFALMDKLALSEKQNSRLEHLSGGQKQRVYLGCALVNNPEIVFLDEPTNGLDPQARHMIWDLLEEIKSDGRSLFLTTHNMEEAAKLANRVAIIDQGKIISEGAARELINQHCRGDILEFSLSSSHKSFDLKQAQSLVQKELEREIATIVSDENLIQMSSKNSSQDILSLMRFADQHQLRIDRLTIRPSTLEDVFFSITGRSIRDV